MLAAVRGTAVAARVIERRLDAMTLPQMRILGFIDRDPIRANALAERAALSRPTLTGLIDGLASRGWVERRPADDDRRGVTFSITPEGRAALSRAQEESADALGELLEELSPAHRAQAVQALGHLATAARIRYDRRLAMENERR